MAVENNHSKVFYHKYGDILVCLFLFIATLIVYWQVHNYDFIMLDDDIYYSENRYVKDGLTIESITWSFTNTISGMWIPLTWLSYMAGSNLYGTYPGWHHLTNVFFHLANILLLYLLLKKLTGSLRRSTFVAILFALHPMHVESVAWITERKDVLSMFFFLLTIWEYCRYADRPTAGKYILMLMFFAMGLMAKPMIVTLPFVLLLLDYWPLNRFKLQSFNCRSDKLEDSRPLYLIFEKIPFFALAVVATVVTFIAHRKLGAIGSFEALPLDTRIANAMVSYVKYIGKLFWPSKMVVLYEYPEILLWWKILGAFLMLAGISWIVIYNVKRRPYLAVGWLWYIGTLIPVIGLVQAGMQSMADRFVYIPFIGLYIIIAWGVIEFIERWRITKIWLTLLAAILFSLLTAATWKQIGYWENSIALFEHTLEVTSNDWLIHNNLGVALTNQGSIDEAVEHLLRALQLQPDNAGVHYNLGVALEKGGRTDEAIVRYSEALRLQPDYAAAHNNLGVALSNQGRLDEAVGHYLKALRLRPDYAVAHSNLGVVLEQKGRLDEAIEHYLTALRLRPDYAEAHYNLGVALAKQGRLDEAVRHYLEALRIMPDYAGAHTNLGVTLAKQGRIVEAVAHYLAALRIKPDDAEARFNLGNALANQGSTDKAIFQYLETLRLRPDYENAHNNLGIALIGKGRIEEAIYHFQEALRINPNDMKARDNLQRALMSRKQG